MKKNLRFPIYKYLFLILIIPLKGLSQEINFSQYNYSPFQVNPGLAGLNNEASVSFINRTNPGGFGISSNTMLLTGIYPIINKLNLIKGGMGVNAFMDESGEDKNFKAYGFSIGYAQNVNINKSSYLSLGLFPGFTQKRISGEGYTTASQWNNLNGYSSGADINENILNHTASYFTLGSGLQWVIKDQKSNNKFYIGVAGFNINRPKVSFYEQAESLPIKYVVNAGIKLYDNSHFIIIPELLYTRFSKTEYFILGSQFIYNFNASPLSALKKGSVTMITRYASTNTLIAAMQFNQPFFSIGFSYDYGFSKNSDLYKSSVYEIVLAFRKPVVRKVKKVRTVDNYNIGEVRELLVEKRINKNSNNNLPEETEDEEGIDEEPVRFALKREFKFKFNDSEITDSEDLQFMADLLKLLNGNRKLKMEIIGHADNIGKEEMNQKVSEERARKVYEYLIHHGIDSKRLIVSGKGAREPVAKNDAEENRARNRRVEFVVFK